MSILIKGIEMPTKENIVILIRPNGDVWMIGDMPNEDTHLVKAQAVPVQPHGRLIDVDVFIEKCEEMADKEDGNQLDALVFLRWFLEQNAPIIIPASEDAET